MPLPDRGGPLAGVRVLEITKVWAGPYTGKILAHLGAEVIKVESLSNIDEMRAYGGVDINAAPYFLSINQEILSVQVNMKTPEGLDLVKQMVAKSDIVIDNIRPGTYLTAGRPAFSLVSNNDLWIDANLKETDLTYVKPGQDAHVSVDTYPAIDFVAEVQSVGAATGSEFSALPAQNATGNWVKVVQRIPVRLKLEPKPDQPQLRAGMSVEVEIDTGHTRSLPSLIHSAMAWIGAEK